MNHLGHMIVGLLVSGAAMFVMQVYSWQLVALALLGSILPDIDLYQSKASKVVGFAGVIAGTIFLQPFFSKFFSTILAAAVALLVSIALLFVALFPLRLKHRGVTHSWKAAAVFSVLSLIALGFAGALVALLAYASHLAVDKL